MRCPKCKYIVAEYFQICPECQEDLSELAQLFGPFYEPNFEFLESLWQEDEEELLSPEEEILFDKLESPEEELFSPAEEETLAAANTSDMALEELEELKEEPPLPDIDEVELEAVEELPEIELTPEDLENSLQESFTEKESEESLDLFEEIEGLEEILPEELKDR